MAKTPPSRVSRGKILADLRLASRRGDRAALQLALDGMRTLALSPRYWEKYLVLLRSPLARLVDLLVIKQGERIAHQKGWRVPRPDPSRRGRAAKASSKESATAPRTGARLAARRRRTRPETGPAQPSLFDEIGGPAMAADAPPRSEPPRRSRGGPRSRASLSG